MQEGGRWFRTSSCWYLLVQEGDRWRRKVVAGSGLVDTGAELVAAGAGKWSLVQDWYLLVQESDHWFRKTVTGAGPAAAGEELVIAAAGRSLVQGW